MISYAPTIFYLLWNDQLQIKTRQPIRLSSSLTKLINLELTEEKKMLMKTSIFYLLCQVENSKESSSTRSIHMIRSISGLDCRQIIL